MIGYCHILRVFPLPSQTWWRLPEVPEKDWILLSKFLPLDVSWLQNFSALNCSRFRFYRRYSCINLYLISSMCIEGYFREHRWKHVIETLFVVKETKQYLWFARNVFDSRYVLHGSSHKWSPIKLAQIRNQFKKCEFLYKDKLQIVQLVLFRSR